MKKAEKIDLDKYCRNSGIILIILGLIHFFLPQYLMFGMGALLIFLGVFSLIFRIKAMIIIIGILLILIGLLNLISSLLYEAGIFWLIFGIFQIYLGIIEIKQYFKIKKIRSKKKLFVWYSLRIGFLVMIFCWLLNILIFVYNPKIGLIFFLFVFIWLTSAIFVFIISIIHLVKHKKKALAIITLILSSFLILTFLIGLFIGVGSTVDKGVEERAKIWDITFDLMKDAKSYTRKAHEFADSCNNHYDLGSSSYDKKDTSMAEYHYLECQNQCHNAISEYGRAKAFYEEAKTKLFEVETATQFTLNINKLFNYWAETSGSAVKVYSNKFEVCEYMETAVVKYSQHDYDSGDWAISKANTKIAQHDYWVGIYNEYLAKSEALQRKIDIEVKYGKEE